MMVAGVNCLHFSHGRNHGLILGNDAFFLNTTCPELLLNLYISFEIFIRRENEKNPYENHPC